MHDFACLFTSKTHKLVQNLDITGEHHRLQTQILKSKFQRIGIHEFSIEMWMGLHFLAEGGHCVGRQEMIQFVPSPKWEMGDWVKFRNIPSKRWKTAILVGRREFQTLKETGDTPKLSVRWEKVLSSLQKLFLTLI